MGRRERAQCGGYAAAQPLFYPRDGQIFAPQRFATDWVLLGEDMRSVRGDVTRNESYSTWGVPVLAVADGEIVDVRSDVPENTPRDVSTPMTSYTVQGNYVILSIGDDRYAAYLHLKPGSVMVEPGDRVRVGQPLALIGNSGNSTSAHLHFHLLDHPSVGQGEGVPFVFDGYRSLGPTAMDLDDIEAGKPWKPFATHEEVNHTADLPPGETVVWFE